jgi:C4-dicarboxylate-specific signal transduction histidine kinase
LDQQDDAACREGLRFFGILSASISHEIKNALAVISESAGLMDDLLVASGKGIPVDEARLKKSADRIRSQVQRSDAIVKNMNAFAHSIDHTFVQADVGQVITLTAALVRRMLDMRGVTVRVEIPAEPLPVKTAPFFLKNLTWLLLDSAAECVEKSKELRVSLEQSESGVDIGISGLEDLGRENAGNLPTPQMRALLEKLHSGMEIDACAGRFTLKLRDLSGAG